MNRRELLTKLSLISFMALLTDFLSACGSSASGGYTTPPTSGGSGGNCNTLGASTSVGAPLHGHLSTAIPNTDILTATQQRYLVPAGSSGHTHTFTVAASNFTTLQTNTAVVLTTDADLTGHSHAITISCSS